ncbi:hypothetical protein, partial [Streptomyces sp. IBSBF 2394]|uniref:hypothetical protein n=1 Tax=Streptomyces sp. IBSBF 2394 TaxID=2903532 RepID=UPI002FDC51BE
MHSRSYTHIIRNVFNDPSTVFDNIVTDPEIVKRAESVTELYDRVAELTMLWRMGQAPLRELKKALILC